MFQKFKIFPISNFSQSQKCPKHPGGGGGGQENGELFPLFVTFFNSEASLRSNYLNKIVGSNGLRIVGTNCGPLNLREASELKNVTKNRMF